MSRFAVVLLVVACNAPVEPVRAPEPVEPVLPVHATKLVFAVSSYSGNDVAGSLAPLVEHLRGALGLDVELRIGEPYRELPQLLRDGVVDVAQLAPLAYVRLSEALPGLVAVATPVIGGSPTYLGHIFVRADSPFHAIEDLRGHSIAFVHDSASGSLFPRDLVRRRGFDPDAFFSDVRTFASHGEVLADLRAGGVDAAASFDLTTDWTGTLQRPEDLRVVAKTERIPNDCLVARPGFDPGTIDALRRALVAIRPGVAKSDAILRALKIDGWVRADNARYDRVRASLARDTGAPAPSGH